MTGLLHSHKQEKFVGKVISIGDFQKDIKLNDERYYRHFIKTKLQVGDNIVLTVTNRKPKRTENQNRYYHGVYLQIISDETGETVERLHTFFKQKFLKKGSYQILGEEVVEVGSTTDLTVSAFIEYILRIEELTGVPAPDTREWSLAPLR